MLYNILKDQWQTIEIDQIRSITQETEFSQMAELLYDLCVINKCISHNQNNSIGTLGARDLELSEESNGTSSFFCRAVEKKIR